MSVSRARMRRGSRRSPAARLNRIVRLAAIAMCLVGTGTASAAPADADLVPVRTIVPVETEYAPDLALTGAIAAQVQTNIAFRSNGKVTARRCRGRPARHGRRGAGDARSRSSSRPMSTTRRRRSIPRRPQLQQATTTFEPPEEPDLASGFTTRATYDQAQETLERPARRRWTGRAAALKTAREQLSYAELKAGRNGIIVSRDVEAGQVVQAGQTVFVAGRRTGRATPYSTIPEALLTAPPEGQDRRRRAAVGPERDDDAARCGRSRPPSIRPPSPSRSRSVSDDDRPQMTLGAAVVGRAHWREQSAVTCCPGARCSKRQGKPAVWVLDAGTAWRGAAGRGAQLRDGLGGPLGRARRRGARGHGRRPVAVSRPEGRGRRRRRASDARVRLPPAAAPLGVLSSPRVRPCSQAGPPPPVRARC